MPPPDRIKHPTQEHDLEWVTTDDGSRTLWNSAINETYHSGCGAVAESMVVYLLNSGVLARLQSGQSTRLFELGFGTGTAFLLTAAIAEKYATSLEYWAVDTRALPSQILSQLGIESSIEKVVRDNFASSAEYTSRQPLSTEAFCNLSLVTNQLFEGLKHIEASEPTEIDLAIGEFCRLHLIVGDATTLGWSTRYSKLISSFDAIYFDAFSPETSPDLWTAEVMQQMFQLLRPNGLLTSYCVKSVVRKTLQSVGFSVDRRPGPVGGKREVLVATRFDHEA